MFFFTAVAHFNSMRPDLVAMVPPFIPNPELMVTFTGVAEILGAAGLLIPRTRRLAAVALIVFLVAVLPANIYAAQAGLTLRGAPVTPLIPRVALQILFIALLWWSGVRADHSGARGQGPGARGQGPEVRGQGRGTRARKNNRSRSLGPLRSRATSPAFAVALPGPCPLAPVPCFTSPSRVATFPPASAHPPPSRLPARF
jgi:uncharacterized membrane protein